jgi:D-threo-aldose 1-dehydrogenase
MAHNSFVRLRTGVEISQLGLGTATLGGLYKSMSEDECTATVEEALNQGITYIDTAPHYGKGTSERRLGRILKGKTGFHLSTKIGRLLVPSTTDIDEYFMDADNTVERFFDYSAKAVEKSIKDSLEKLQMDSVDFVFIHDPDDQIYIEQGIKEAFPALEKMRNQGLIKGIGVGMNQNAAPTRFINETDIDMVLIAGRQSLLDQSAAAELLPTALKRGVDIIAAGVFNSGILANPVKGATYDYGPASDELIARAQHIRNVLDEHGVSITAAAMQFPLRHPAVKAVIVGCRSAQEVRVNCAAFDAPIAEVVWKDLDLL